MQVRGHIRPPQPRRGLPRAMPPVCCVCWRLAPAARTTDTPTRHNNGIYAPIRGKLNGEKGALRVGLTRIPKEIVFPCPISILVPLHKASRRISRGMSEHNSQLDCQGKNKSTRNPGGRLLRFDRTELDAAHFDIDNRDNR